MIRLPLGTTRTAPPFPHTTLFRSFKAGGAYLALDERHPPARSARMLVSSAAPVLVTPRDNLAQVEAILAELAQPPRVLIYEELHTRRSEEHTSELQSLMRTSYAVFCLKKKNNTRIHAKNKII